MVYRHGSHPCHGFEQLTAAPSGRACSVCKALSDGSDVRWFGCVAAPCEFLLCEKCFNVKEELLEEPQVMIRNPMLDYDDTDAAIRTRPRPGSYCLSMLYGGRLMRVLSSAADEADPTQLYFRIASGGWIKKSHVVCVHPHTSPSMQLLTEVHFNNRKLGDDIASGAVQFEVLRNLLLDCMETMDDNVAYGIVMSALVMYPLLSTVEVPLRSFRVAPDPLPVVEYTYFILQFVHTKLSERMNQEDMQFDFRLSDSTMTPLFGDVLARCLYVAYCLTCNWKVRLSSSFVDLVVRSLATLDRLRLLLREEPLDQPPVLTAPAVTIYHSSVITEKQRLCRLFLYMSDMGGKLLQQCIKDTRLDLCVLQPIRDQLCSSASPSLSKVFCEALATFAEVDLHRVQNTFLDIDALEVVGNLAATAPLAESQMAVYRVVQHLATQSPANIALTTVVLLHSLLDMLTQTQSPAAYVAAMDCFYELAFNDPRYRGAKCAGAEMPQPQLHVCSAVSAAASAAPGTTTTPYQLLHTYRLPSGAFVPLCAFCAAHHPPSACDVAERPQYAYFHCSCTHCGGELDRPAGRSNSLPSIPLTAALRVLEAQLPEKVLTLAPLMQIPQALNALGRVLLRVPPNAAVIVRMIDELVRYTSLEQVPHAALVVKANAHLPPVLQRLANCGDTELGQYVLSMFDVVTPAKNYVEETPAKSHRDSELGLSASPYTSSTLQSGSLYEMRGGLSSYTRDLSLGVQLFGGGASVEE
ncbi:hypothetical protein ABB37_04113 [Leptomonas pyrrhocoris]|uniref:Uncharacterized protein n=1 Tax=Leptomonas pyrrhocoris TaxID=157538 RepID=A0A0M9G4B8_LEPPY|nr:hypothetical protein ABB37_04113 [Leptomonas pyrrhocoris]KPA81859.1 hypothetical protein ABB37_04113 [Leptomonas pyrrhocoris]|eukprot:XP_015660298.1 hypothetical protein ABB37_04113 [Leptomonas pyrrhocoris]